MKSTEKLIIQNQTQTYSLDSRKRRDNHLTFSSPITAIQDAFQSFVSFLMSGNDLQIQQKADRFGNEYWSVFDPITGRRQQLESEDDVRVWLDNRFYQ